MYIAVMIYVILSILMQFMGYSFNITFSTIFLFFVILLVRLTYRIKYIHHFLYFLDNESKIILTKGAILVKTGVPFWMRIIPLSTVANYYLHKEGNECDSYIVRSFKWAIGKGDKLILLDRNHKKIYEIQLWAYSDVAKDQLLSFFRKLSL